MLFESVGRVAALGADPAGGVGNLRAGGLCEAGWRCLARGASLDGCVSFEDIKFQDEAKATSGLGQPSSPLPQSPRESKFARCLTFFACGLLMKLKCGPIRVPVCGFGEERTRRENAA